ncbi:MAG: superoxide dismutase family protein [Clostridia bacterium]|nr:superoxide dismutase family protein [Clostridia bacterium]
MLDINFSGGFSELSKVLSHFPDAVCIIRGDDAHPLLAGIVMLFDTEYGTIIAAEIKGLPIKPACESGVFGFHIHEGPSCESQGSPFSETGGHYNPISCPHPAHAGDMPPLISGNGYAISVFLCEKITTREVIGRTIVIHSDSDDFKTQPAGNSGSKIACGKIMRI